MLIVSLRKAEFCYDIAANQWCNVTVLLNICQFFILCWARIAFINFLRPISTVTVHVQSCPHYQLTQVAKSTQF